MQVGAMRQPYIFAIVMIATFLGCPFIHSTSGTCTTSSDLGRVECHLFYEYSTYQWAACVTKDYIQRVSSARGKEHRCLDKNATQCFYPCMKESHDTDNGTVLSSCRCSGPASPPTDIPSLAPQCFSPPGDSCQWYRQCLNERYNCTGSRYDYAIGYGKKFCDLFGTGYNQFGSVAREWVDATRKCLQVELVSFLRPWVTATCMDIYDDAFSTHPGCYLAPANGAPSICHLPCTDLWKIFWLVSFEGGALLSEPIETSTQMLQVAIGCLADYTEDIMCLPVTVQRLVYLGVTADRLRSVLDTAQKVRDFAGRITQAIAEISDWEGKGLGWFPLSNVADKMTETKRQKRNDNDDNVHLDMLHIQVLLVNRNYLNITQFQQDDVSTILGRALFDLATSVRKGEMSLLTIAVDGIDMTARVSEVGHCYNMGCNESYVITGAPSCAVHVDICAYLVLTMFLIFITHASPY